MEKVLTSFVTFIVGVFGFYAFNAKSDRALELTAPAQTSVEVSTSRLENVSVEKPTKKTENLEFFFDSFDSDEGYSGWFIADDFKGMPEVWTILLDRSDDFSKDEKFVWSAMILTQHPDYTPNDDDNFQSVWIKTEGSHLSFRTNKIRGIEYKFDGEFVKNGASFEQEEKVLRGTLQKIVKDKRVARFTADFGYFEPHCFH